MTTPATITQALTALPDAPDPAIDSPTTFSAKAAAMVLAIKAMIIELIAWTTQANAVAADVNSNATTAAAGAGVATAQAAIATAQANAAAASAATALNAPGTSATSATNLTVGSGSKTFTLAQTGKAFSVGQWVSVCDSATPATNWMLAAITAFNSGTGVMTVTVVAAAGTLTGASWVVAAAAPANASGLPVTPVAGTAQAAVAGNHYLMTNAAVSTLTLPAAPAANDEVWVTFTNGLYTNSVARNGKTIYGDSLDFTINSGVLLTWKFKYLNNDWKTV